MSKANNKKRPNLPFLSNLEDFESPALGDLENDPSLEAELMELMGGGGGNPRPKVDRTKNKNTKPITIDKNLLNLDLNDDITDGDIDEDDPELLAELDEFLSEEKAEEPAPMRATPSSQSGNVAKLENLQNLYQEAVKNSTDPSKSRRYDRSLKSINELLIKAKKGIPVDENEFPPPVHVPAPKIPEPVKQSIEPPVKASRPSIPENPQKHVITALTNRQNEYKLAAIEQRSQNVELAKALLDVYKQFNEVIAAVTAGEPFDLDDLPPPPSEFQLGDEKIEETVEIVEKPQSLPLGEELKIRLAFYTDSVTKATNEGNDGKIRRLNRVVQQYREAIDAFRKNIVFPFEELPPPPGRPPLAGRTTPANPAVTQSAHANAIPPASGPTKPKPASKTEAKLVERQIEFKSAAMKAKSEGDMALAKELLRNSMSIEKMVQAARNGLPVDLSQLPALPTEISDIDFVSERCDIPGPLSGIIGAVGREGVLEQLQAALLEQIATCRRYSSAVSLAGDVIGAKRFLELGKSCEKDLHALRWFSEPQNRETALPRFHYEFRSFSITEANPELGEGEMSVEIVGGMNLAPPQGYSVDQFDTYVVLELPFPADACQTATTDTVRKSNSPAYNFVHKFQVNLKSRVFQRVVKSKVLKADIYYRKGFLQKDKIYGTCSIKLEKLEKKCTIHDSWDIVENRKVVAGKLEVKVRIRSPIGGIQSQVVKEKWLVIDGVNRVPDNTPMGSVTLTSPPGQSSGSIEVLRYEIMDMKKKLAARGSQVPQSLMNSIKQKIAEKETIARRQEEKLQSPDPTVKLMYLQEIAKLPLEYNNEAKRLLGENNRDKAQIAMTKKRLVEKEIEQLKEARRK